MEGRQKFGWCSPAGQTHTLLTYAQTTQLSQTPKDPRSGFTLFLFLMPYKKHYMQ